MIAECREGLTLRSKNLQLKTYYQLNYGVANATKQLEAEKTENVLANIIPAQVDRLFKAVFVYVCIIRLLAFCTA